MSFLKLLLLSSFLSFFISSQIITIPFTTEHISPKTTLTSSFLELPEVPVTDNGQDRDCIEACFGSPSPQCFKLVIQSGSFYIWIPESKSEQKSQMKFDISKSASLERNMTEIVASYGQETVTGFQGKDYLWLQNQKIGKINFILSKKSNSFTDYEGMIGLGYTPASYEEKFSLIQQLYINKVIPHRVFSQSFKTSGKGEISIGEIPKYIVDDYENYGRCHALDKIKEGKKFKNKNWQCEINGIYFGNRYDEDEVKVLYNSKVSFFSYRRRALFPKKIYEYLSETYFKRAIERGDCEATVLKRYDTFLCEKGRAPEEDMNLVFGDWVIRLPQDKLFKRNKGVDKLEFIFSHKKDYEKWTLGRPIVQLFHMVYDYQNEEIGFYSKQYNKYIGKSSIAKPTVYEMMYEEPAPVKPPSNPSPSKPIYVPANPEHVGDNNANNVHTNEIAKSSYKVTDSLAMILKVFIVLAIVFLLVVAVFSFIKYKNRNKLRNNFYIMKTEQFMKSQK